MDKMEDGRTDALECARRALEAIADTTDLETRQSLWNAAKRYHGRHVMERDDRRLMAVPLPRAVSGEAGWGTARELF
jgi:hypothetical protein